jgi:spore germination cell wall hydrolase CwlJ-like protein
MAKVAALLMVLLLSVSANAKNWYDFISQKEMVCITEAIYYEARNQPFIGQVAVAHTIINRVMDWRFHDTFCKVIKQRRHYSYRNGVPYNRMLPMPNKEATAKALLAAQHAITSAYDITEGATHYHKLNIDPYWRATKRQLVSINDHIFYRWDDYKEGAVLKLEEEKSITPP